MLLALMLVTPAFGEVAATVMRHSVVRVEVGCQGEAGFQWLSGGTGFFIGEEEKDPSYLLTNYHVIETFIGLGSGAEQTDNPFWTFFEYYVLNIEGMTADYFNGLSEEDQNSIVQTVYNEIYVKFAGSSENATYRSSIRVYYDDREFDEAYLVDYGNSTKDMALLRLDKPTDKRAPIALCEPSENMVKSPVTAIGYPGASGSVFDPVSQKGENDSTVTAGTVSRLQTQSGTGLRVVQYDASINSGNSGGPLILDENGAVIAINTWGTTGDSNMFFGVSMSEVLPMLDRNNVTYELEGDPFESTTTSSTESTTTTTTETTTTTTTWSITIFDYTFNRTQCILGVLGLIALIAIIVLAVKHFRRKDDDKGDDDSPAGDSGSSNETQIVGGNVKVDPPQHEEPKVDPNDSLFRVQCVRGALGTRRIAIPRTGQIIMGRSEQCGIRFPSDTKGVSGRHCAVYYEGGSVYIKDVGSSFGTFVDPGRRLSANESVEISEGQKFWLGSENEMFTIERKKM